MTESEKNEEINRIIEEWKEEVKKLPVYDEPNRFNHAWNSRRRALEKKYTAMLDELMKEN